MRDARHEHNPSPEYAKRLISLAAEKHGSRNKVSEMSGISRRHLQYLERGFRVRAGRKIPVMMDFSMQVVLESLAGVCKP